MCKKSLNGLKQQIDVAIKSDTPEAPAALKQELVEALRQMGDTCQTTSVQDDELECMLRTIEDAWLKGSSPPVQLPGNPDQQARLSRLLLDMLALQSFALSMSRGDLSPSLKAKGVMAGSFKALQGNIRHLTWQTRMIAKGDFSQRVDFLGEFAESFNSMIESLDEARDQIDRHVEELSRMNTALTAEIAERERAEEALRKARDTLEERVKERTSELCKSNESLRTEIAERKLAERALKEVEENLRAYMKKLEWANRQLSDFAFIASHDLQEPLRKIQVLGDLLRMKTCDVLNQEELGLLEKMRGSAERMRKQIGALLDYSHLTMRAEPFQPIGLNSLVGEVIADLHEQIEETQATVEVLDLPNIEADYSQIIILFRNLISNALKFYGERPPLIKIYSRELGKEDHSKSAGCRSYCHIFVEDRGIGFDEKYLSKIFAPFQRLHGPNKYEGIGMGLAICRKIAELHGGAITARSEPDHGATFIISLPKA